MQHSASAPAALARNRSSRPGPSFPIERVHPKTCCWLPSKFEPNMRRFFNGRRPFVRVQRRLALMRLPQRFPDHRDLIAVGLCRRQRRLKGILLAPPLCEGRFLGDVGFCAQPTRENKPFDHVVIDEAQGRHAAGTSANVSRSVSHKRNKSP